MPTRLESRSAETRAVADFLSSASDEPSALVIEGEAGIGKTTLWLAALERARESGFQVLSARPTEAESTMAHASLADLLAGVDQDVWAKLPELQRLAVDRVMLRANDGAAATDQSAVAAAFLSVISELADEASLLVAIDDLQWLDVSSAHVMAFVTRRLSGRVRLLVTVRTEIGGASAGG